MLGGPTDCVNISQTLPIIETKGEDGRTTMTVPNTPIVVVGTDPRIVLEEVRRQVHTFLYLGASAPKASF